MSNAQNMTNNESHRIDKVEQNIVGLSGRIDGVEGRLTNVEGGLQQANDGLNQANAGINQLLNKTGGMEAQRGMVPISHIWSFIGAFLTIIGIGLTVLWNYDGRVDEKIKSSEKTITSQIELSREKINSLKVHVLENDNKISHIVGLEKAVAALEQKLNITWGEFKAHTAEQDHPLRQTESIKALLYRMERLEDDYHERKSIPKSLDSKQHPH